VTEVESRHDMTTFPAIRHGVTIYQAGDPLRKILHRHGVTMIDPDP